MAAGDDRGQDEGDAGSGGQPARRPPVRQRREPGGRPHKHSVRMSDAEQAIVDARAGQAGVSVPRFLVEAGLAGDAASASQLRANAAELLAARRLVAAVGVNLNQLAKVANATGEVPAALEATMHATLRFLARLDAATALYGEFGLPYGRRAVLEDDADHGLDVEAEVDRHQGHDADHDQDDGRGGGRGW
ncbi:plasmid mobilization protein [Streptosporangium amethystogenes]|uniref:plasmid mobilization protein n=1 Tax=Streptosporangium amethystogenes TaxID=2002 RepID=UPI0006905BF9|nr:plasmid mobilization relaxosome protein MobC [Streptosporangium amethystogenes]